MPRQMYILGVILEHVICEVIHNDNSDKVHN